MQADTNTFLTVAEFEQHAKGRIAPQAEAFYFSGCFKERTYRENTEGFNRYRFRPRFLQDVSVRNMSTSVLGQSVSCPFGVSPMGACCIGHPDGEMAIAKACERMKIPFGLSTLATTSIEDIASGAPNSLRWFQLYVFKERRLTEWLVRRAEVAGFSALVLTVDAPIPAEDAREAVSHGAAAVWVSNHGGRQLDGTPATIDVLPEVVTAVNGQCEVYLDSGVRSGYDVIKGLALGARMVFIGRPVLCGLICNGSEGVCRVLDIIKEELDNGMALLGSRNIMELSRSHVVHESLLPRL